MQPLSPRIDERNHNSDMSVARGRQISTPLLFLPIKEKERSKTKDLLGDNAGQACICGVKSEDLCLLLVLQNRLPIKGSHFLWLQPVWVVTYCTSPEIFVWAKANMPTSTNMQSSTHLPLLVVVVAMAERLKSLPHPGKPPTKDVMQREGREKEKKKEKRIQSNMSASARLWKKKNKNNTLTCLDCMAFSRSGNLPLLGSNMFLLMLLHDNTHVQQKIWLVKGAIFFITVLLNFRKDSHLHYLIATGYTKVNTTTQHITC